MTQHHIHVTEGIVLRKRGVGEANALVFLLTREHGLVGATATSARKAASKLRYGLEPFTSGRFSLVRGKLGWRLVGVERIERDEGRGACNRAASGRVARLLTRLIHGEERAPALFDDVRSVLPILARAPEGAQLLGAEVLVLARILNHLGYLPAEPELAPFLSDPLDEGLALRAHEARSRLVRVINESLLASGL